MPTHVYSEHYKLVAIEEIEEIEAISLQFFIELVQFCAKKMCCGKLVKSYWFQITFPFEGNVNYIELGQKVLNYAWRREKQIRKTDLTQKVFSTAVTYGTSIFTGIFNFLINVGSFLHYFQFGTLKYDLFR